jgi:hypothetical protein
VSRPPLSPQPRASARTPRERCKAANFIETPYLDAGRGQAASR